MRLYRVVGRQSVSIDFDQPSMYNISWANFQPTLMPTTLSRSELELIRRLEERLEQLEVNLRDKRRRTAETEKMIRQREQVLADYATRAEDGRKAWKSAQEHIGKLQQKVKVYKHQVEEAVSCYVINAYLVSWRKPSFACSC